MVNKRDRGGLDWGTRGKDRKGEEENKGCGERGCIRVKGKKGGYLGKY